MAATAKIKATANERLPLVKVQTFGGFDHRGRVEVCTLNLTPVDAVKLAGDLIEAVGRIG